MPYEEEYNIPDELRKKSPPTIIPLPDSFLDGSIDDETVESSSLSSSEDQNNNNHNLQKKDKKRKGQRQASSLSTTTDGNNQPYGYDENLDEEEKEKVREFIQVADRMCPLESFEDYGVWRGSMP